MALLTQLCLVVLHALTLVVAPPALRVGEPSVRVAAARSVSEEREPTDVDEGFRATSPLARCVVARPTVPAPDAPPLRPLAGGAAPHLGAPPVALKRAATRRVSHAIAARGGHLLYFPTAPPLRG